eukprot:CAMPEP_0113581074 /NCGR_PEP_ID=MMETSP0015_2-20120614/31060_1 /TAXON_ID=2838 /ORGANISM="Odontella" /LENGTH=565 /DNA_ID=CAMNT_0000485401 /DNA_START=275 /DNA_END=1968 /DNA_ORIENTATION=- /assembly_acc=CAM_ASM_000160
MIILELEAEEEEGDVGVGVGTAAIAHSAPPLLSTTIHLRRFDFSGGLGRSAISSGDSATIKSVVGNVPPFPHATSTSRKRGILVKGDESFKTHSTDCTGVCTEATSTRSSDSIRDGGGSFVVDHHDEEDGYYWYRFDYEENVQQGQRQASKANYNRPPGAGSPKRRPSLARGSFGRKRIGSQRSSIVENVLPPELVLVRKRNGAADAEVEEEGFEVGTREGLILLQLAGDDDVPPVGLDDILAAANRGDFHAFDGVSEHRDQEDEEEERRVLGSAASRRCNRELSFSSSPRFSLPPPSPRLRRSRRPPRILTPPLMEALQAHFSDRVSGHHLWMKYSLRRGDEPSLPALLRAVWSDSHTVLAVETAEGEVFGSFSSSAWRRGPSYFGDGEVGGDFLWRAQEEEDNCGYQRAQHDDSRRGQEEEEEEESDENENKNDVHTQVNIFPWSGRNDCVQLCTPDEIALGGWELAGDRRQGDAATGACISSSTVGTVGLCICADMKTGFSSPCPTFRNPPLSSGSVSFKIADVEAWALTPFIPGGRRPDEERQSVEANREEKSMLADSLFA